MRKHMSAILWKQMKDTLKNKTILIQFIMFPILTVVMETAIEIQGMPEHFFANLFAVMYLGMAPITSMAAIISEEREKNTLRVLFLSNVKPAAYLIGVGVYIWVICMLGALVIGIAGKYASKELMAFMGIMGIGIIVSIIIGAVIGTMSKNQMAQTSITVPVMMVFSFLPMLSMFNEKIEKLARFVYTGQIHNFISQMDSLEIKMEQIAMIALNLLIAVVLFVYFYKKKGLE